MVDLHSLHDERLDLAYSVRNGLSASILRAKTTRGQYSGRGITKAWFRRCGDDVTAVR